MRDDGSVLVVSLWRKDEELAEDGEDGPGAYRSGFLPRVQMGIYVPNTIVLFKLCHLLYISLTSRCRC